MRKNNNNKTQYTTIHVPVALAELIDALLDSGQFAYASRSEFVKDAIRHSLVEHGFYPNSSWLERTLTDKRLDQHLNKRIKQLKELRSLALQNGDGEEFPK